MNEKPRHRKAPGFFVLSPVPTEDQEDLAPVSSNTQAESRDIRESLRSEKKTPPQRNAGAYVFPAPSGVAFSLDHIPKYKAFTKHEEQPRCASFENTELERVACSATAAKQAKKCGEPACSPHFQCLISRPAIRALGGPDRRVESGRLLSSCLRRAASW